MRFIVMGDSRNCVDHVVKHGTKVGFEMVPLRDRLTHVLASTAHAVIYVIDDTANDIDNKIQDLLSVMKGHNLKRLVISTISKHKTASTEQLAKSGIDWTIVREPHTKAEINFEDYARFVISEATNSNNLCRSIVRETPAES